MARCRTHRVSQIEYRGKTDSVYVTCGCGKVECFATWWDQPPKGWSKRQWPRLIEAIRLYLRSLHPRS